MKWSPLSSIVILLTTGALTSADALAADSAKPAVAKPAPAVRASVPTATLIPSTDPSKQIRDLQWPNPNPPLKVERQGESISVSVEVLGKFVRDDWALLWGSNHVTIGPGGEFRLKLPVTKDSFPIYLMAISPLGETETTEVTVKVPNWNAIRSEVKTAVQRHFVSAGVGPTWISFSQSGAGRPAYSVSETVLTGKASYSFVMFPPRWEVGLSAFGTLMVLSSSSAPEDYVKFIGANARIGYIVSQVREPFKLSLMTGIYYTTMPTELGFSNLMGPQLFPVLRRRFNNGSSVSGYFKFSPVGEGIGVVKLSNREIASGVSYNHLLKNGHPLSFSMDWANISIELFDEIGEAVPISSTSLSFGVSYGF